MQILRLSAEGAARYQAAGVFREATRKLLAQTIPTRWEKSFEELVLDQPTDSEGDRLATKLLNYWSLRLYAVFGVRFGEKCPVCGENHSIPPYSSPTNR